MNGSSVWTREATALRCPFCHASPGARCRASSGRYATQPHVSRLVPSFTCPQCLTITTEPTNVASGYCASCHDWTAPTARPLAAQDEFAL